MRSSFLAYGVGLLLAVGLRGQTPLTLGPGVYTQTFDQLGSGMPEGWQAYSGATASTLGTAVTLTTAPTTWEAGAGGAEIRNIASDTIVTAANAATQHATANRALGIRPSNAATRNSAATLHLANTAGLTVSTLRVKLFTANSVSGEQTYQFEYRIGETGNFLVAGPAYTTAGRFSAAVITASTATLAALSNQTGPLQIRIRGTNTVGSGDMDTLGIDDFTLGVRSPATIALGSLTATYDGRAHPATAVTDPAGLPVVFTYNGATTAPVTPGTYAVVATIDDANYFGSATGTLVISPAVATVSLGGLTAFYDGTPRPVTATTFPAGPPVDVIYTGTNGTVYGPSATAPTAVGTYQVTAAVNHAHYTGAASALLTIAPGPQLISFPRPADRHLSEAAFPLNASSTSGLPVGFALVSGSTAATLAGNVITLTGLPGSVTVRAFQDGDGNYLAATPVDRTFEVVAQLAAPQILVPPTNVTAPAGASATFTVVVGGSPYPALQWRKNGTPIAGATDAALFFPSIVLTDSAIYDVVATNLAGSVTTTSVALVVGQQGQTITFEPATTLVPAGTAITLNATASSGLAVVYSLVSGTGALNGSTLNGTGSVTVRASQPGNAAYAAASPIDRAFNFVTGVVSPFLVRTPVNTTATAGGGVSFTASAIGNPAPTYQWSKDGRTLAGATQAALTFGAVTLADSGRYTVTATNLAGTASASALLTVRTPPVIVIAPGPQDLMSGSPLTLSVVATGSPAPTYQWRKNGAALAGATGSTFSVAPATAVDSGSYDVVVTNALASVTSPPATVTVTTRIFAGVYVGRFAGMDGDVALYVRPNDTAVLLAHIPPLQTGVVVLDVRLDPTGAFTTATTTLASLPENSAVRPGSSVVVASQPVTVRGNVDDRTGTLTGTIPELGVAFAGARAPGDSVAAGYYEAAAIGTAATRIFVVVEANGSAFVVAATGQSLDSGRGAIGANGRLTATLLSGATVDLGFPPGTVSGTLRSTSGVTVAVAGASDALTRRERLINLSVRSMTANAAPLITGFVISGQAAKQVLVRAAGPALAAAPFNVSGVVPNPTLQLFRGSAMIGQNDNWNAPATNGTAVAAATSRSGAFPFANGSQDAALVATLAPGAYTVIVGGGNGAALAEVYEVLENNEGAGVRRLMNVSARGLAAPGAPLIGGFVISGSGPQRVLVRGIGPRLAAAPFNVPGALANPQLTLFRGSTVVRTNDDWFRDAEAASISEAATRTGAFALGPQSLDSALLLFLEPGAYTAQVSAAGGANVAGVGLVEVYEVR